MQLALRDVLLFLLTLRAEEAAALMISLLGHVWDADVSAEELRRLAGSPVKVRQAAAVRVRETIGVRQEDLLKVETLLRLGASVIPREGGRVEKRPFGFEVEELWRNCLARQDRRRPGASSSARTQAGRLLSRFLRCLPERARVALLTRLRPDVVRLLPGSSGELSWWERFDCLVRGLGQLTSEGRLALPEALDFLSLAEVGLLSVEEANWGMVCEGLQEAWHDEPPGPLRPVVIRQPGRSEGWAELGEREVWFWGAWEQLTWN